jgi:leader peptidase (prepilin peptidase)/N-methyltransferase
VSDLPAGLCAWGGASSFALGAIVGSFLNVVIARVPGGESVVWPGSRCPACRTPIAWYDNVPILSWLVLGARCRRCRGRISWRYPLVELLGALAALAAFARHGIALATLAELGFAAALLALAFIDLDTWLLPHAITWPLLAAGAVLSVAGLTPAGAVVPSLLGAALGWGAFALVSFAGAKAFRKEALGFGDVWLLAAIGAWLGPKALLPVVLLASLQGSVVGLALILMGRSQPGPDAPSVPGGARAGEEGAPPPQEPGQAGAGPPPQGACGEAGQAPPPGPAELGTAPGAVQGGEAVDPTDDDWVPPRHAVPFGPFLAAGALEWLWLQDWLTALVPPLGLLR